MNENNENVWDVADKALTENNEDENTENNPPVISNVIGLVINENGYIVSKFGFFIDTDTIDDDKIAFKISPDGFLGKLYNEPIKILLGYGSESGVPGVVDYKKASIIELGPDNTGGDSLIISIANDDDFKTKGVYIIVRDKDVDVNLLNPEIKEQYLENLDESKNEDNYEDLSDIEKSYIDYIKHVYVNLTEELKNDDNIEQEEIYE